MRRPVELIVRAVKQVLEMGVQFGLIRLGGQHVVSPLSNDLLGGAFMAAQGIGGDDAALEI